MYVRNAREEDLDELEIIYRAARDFMRKTGNMQQWVGVNFPGRHKQEKDLARGVLRVVVADADDAAENPGVLEGDLIAAFAFIEGEDPNYIEMLSGSWPDDKPYAAVHRIASNGKLKGVAKVIFGYATEYAAACGINLRADTHDDNKVMQKKFTDNGFVFCGYVMELDNMSPRRAYQKTVL